MFNKTALSQAISQILQLRSNEGWLHKTGLSPSQEETLDHLGSGLPDYSPVSDLQILGKQLLAQAVEKGEQLYIEPFIPKDDTEGSGAALLAYRRGVNQPISFIKVFDDLLAFAKELSAQNFLQKLKLDMSGVASLQALARVENSEKELFLLASSVILAPSLAQLMKENSAQLPLALRLAGQALADLHTAGVKKSRVAEGQWEHACVQMGNWGLKADEVLAPYAKEYGLDRKLLMDAVMELLENPPNGGTPAYTHGDLHLGNCLYDRESHQLFWVDLGALHDSIGEEGGAQGIAEWDFVHLQERLSEMGLLLGMEIQRVKELQQIVKEAYALDLDPEALRFFKIHSCLLTLSEFFPVLDQGGKERRKCVEQMLRFKVERLKSIL